MQFTRRHSPKVPTQDHTRHFTRHTPTIESFRPGYPRLSALLHSDNQFVLFRRFGHLHTRILLHKQDALTELEQRLTDLDTNDANQFFLHSRRSDRNAARLSLLDEIDVKLKDYDGMLQAYLQQVERPRPEQRDIESVTHWLDGNKPLVADESTFLNNWDDLVAPAVPTTRSGIETFVGSCAATLHNRQYCRLFTKSEDRKKSTDKNVIHITANRIVWITRLLICLASVTLLFIPIVLLYNLKSTTTRLGVVALCAALFAVFVSSLSQVRLVEVFAATSAFCALLLSFIGNFPKH